MRNALFISLITAASIILLTCGEAEIQPPPTPGPGTGPPASGPLTDEQRLAVLKECKDFVNALGDLKSEVAQQALVTWLRARPEFEEADTLGGNVWAYFHDGRLAMIIPNWLGVDENDGGRVGLPADDGKKKKAQATGRTSGLPGTNQVKLFFGLGKAFKDYRPFLKDIFSESERQSNAKYNVTLEDASIENLENTDDLGIFYFDTHGGLGLKKPREEMKSLFGLWTTDTTSLANESTYEADLNSYYLVYMLAAQNDLNVKEWHYGITENFVRNHAHMNFAKNAVLYIDACNGTTPDADAFMESMIKKAKGGQATYIGWDGLMSSSAGKPAAGFIFNRMLGTHKDIILDQGTISAENPKQRPFDFSQIFDDMERIQVGRYPLGESRSGGRLTFVSDRRSEVILRPSIEYLGVDEYESAMYIKGLFGDEGLPGDDNMSDLIVTVGGEPVPTKREGLNLLRCQLPTTGPGSVGDVVVTIRGNKSNVVPLTEWIIPLDFEKEEMDIMIKGRLNLRIRGDVHPYRSKPHEAPKNERPDSLGFLSNPNFFGWPFAIGSTGNYTAGGRHYTECVSAKCHVIESLTALRKNGVLSYSIFEEPGDGFVGYYKWSVDMKTLYVSALHAKVPSVGHEFESRVDCGQDPFESNQSDKRELEIRIPEDLPVLQLHIDENYNIQTGDFESSKDVTNQWGQCTGTVKLNVKVKWPDVSPRFPPTRETESRVGGD